MKKPTLQKSVIRIQIGKYIFEITRTLKEYEDDSYLEDIKNILKKHE